MSSSSSSSSPSTPSLERRSVIISAFSIAAAGLALLWYYRRDSHPRHRHHKKHHDHSAPVEVSSAHAAEATISQSGLVNSDVSAPSIRPLVVCGPSGVGKGTLLNRLKAEFPDAVSKTVSHTTRQPRQGELNGVHYHFTDRDAMEKEIKQNKFIEYAQIHGNLYGTSVEAVDDVSKAGKICILEIDVQGADNIKKTNLNPYYLFILPPNHDSLKDRLTARGTETEEQLMTRLKTAEFELNWLKENEKLFHHKLVNDDLEHAYQQLKEKIIQFYPHLKERQHKHHHHHPNPQLFRHNST